jgi:signal transduction histidine kinase
VVEEDQPAVEEVSSDLQTGRTPTRVSANRNYRKDGSIVFCEWYNSSLVDDEGKLRSILSLVLDVTDRKRLEQELVGQADQLARANRLKDEFLATLSHELRTPINAILGWSRILTTTAIGADMQKRGLEVIAQNAAVQTRQIEDVLDLSRIVTGNFRLEVQAVDAAAAIRTAVDSVRQAAAAKNLAFHVEPVPAVTLTADAARLQQVLWNLLSNSVKFTPPGGKIFVAARQVDGVFEFEVRDTGIGISPEFLPRVFERFAQADASSTREHGGLGLGLAIVRHIVELHGGSVTAASGGPGSGSTFVARLPVRPVPAR